MPGLECRFPQPVMRRQCAINAAQLSKAPVKKHEMHGFVCANFHPVIDKIAREFGTKPADQIECKVNGGKFDMRQCMQHRDAARLSSTFTPFGHLPRWQQFGLRRARWPVGHVGFELVGHSPEPPVACRFARGHDLRLRIGGGEDG